MDYYSKWLTARQREGNYRSLQPLLARGHGVLQPENQPASRLFDFSSNDYLALSEHPALLEAAAAALKRYGSGAGAARLMSGDLRLYHALEELIAEWKGQQAALLFGSGYLANVGVIPALVNRGDLLFCDRYNHASIYDGCRLADAQLLRFRHNDLTHLETLLQRKKPGQKGLIIVESIYSMDGDFAPLAGLVALKERYDCLLLVDEAHATGLFGASGSGLVEEQQLADGVDLVMGTFSKALGSYGAYVAGSRLFIDYLVNRARSFIFSTALPPMVVAASMAAVQLVREQPAIGRELWQKCALFKQHLAQHGIETNAPSQIIPIIIGDSSKAVTLAQSLRQHGIYATAVRPPTVPANTARLRFSVTRHLDDACLAQTAKRLAEALALLPQPSR